MNELVVIICFEYFKHSVIYFVSPVPGMVWGNVAGAQYIPTKLMRPFTAFVISGKKNVAIF